MERDIKKLLAKKPLTGEDVGRLMILNLLAIYENLMDGGDGSGVLTNEEKMNLVNSLSNTHDIKHFNDFKGVHDFLMTVGAVYESYAKSYEVYYLKLIHFLNDIKSAELEIKSQIWEPTIMTEEEYKAFLESGVDTPLGGIAVYQENPSHTQLIMDSVMEKKVDFTFEYAIKNNPHFIREMLEGIKDMLAECFARQKALEITGDFINIPHVKNLIIPINEDLITDLNELIYDVISITMCNASLLGQDTDKISETLKFTLVPIDVLRLKPDESSIKKAKKTINFSIVKHSSESFIASLKRKWRDDCVL